ncbi:MAG: DUF354 domain-containing protein, partial [Nanoarchaeota archaeon]
GIEHTTLSTKGKGPIGLVLELCKHSYGLLKLAKKFKPDVLMGYGGMSIAPIGKLLRKPSISFYDAEHATIILKVLTLPLITKMCTPSCYTKDYGKKHIRFNGYKELAYLHPDYYTPSEKTLRKIGVAVDEKYFIVRFVSWDASHDINVKRLGIEDKRKLILLLERFGKVFISAEDDLVPADLQKYLLKIDPKDFMDIIAFSSLVVSEGASVASEAAVLGIPTIYINHLNTSYLDEESDRYHLVEKIVDGEKLLLRVEEMLNYSGLKEEWKSRRKEFLKDKIDVTGWTVSFINQAVLLREEQK